MRPALGASRSQRQPEPAGCRGEQPWRAGCRRPAGLARCPLEPVAAELRHGDGGRSVAGAQVHDVESRRHADRAYDGITAFAHACRDPREVALSQRALFSGPCCGSSVVACREVKRRRCGAVERASVPARRSRAVAHALPPARNRGERITGGLEQHAEGGMFGIEHGEVVRRVRHHAPCAVAGGAG